MERQQRSEPGPHYPHHEPDSPPHFHQIGFQVCELVLRRERRMGVVFQGIPPALFEDNPSVPRDTMVEESKCRF